MATRLTRDLADASPDPSSDITIAPIQLLTLTRPQDAAVVKLGPDATDTGCSGTVSRLSSQTIDASGALTVSTSSLDYQIQCQPASQSVIVGVLALGDDGTRGWIQGQVPLVLGNQPLLDAPYKLATPQM